MLSAADNSAAHVDEPQTAGRATDRTLLERYRHLRRLSEAFCQPLALEDYGLQAAAETSPPKWHLAHTSWFFETFLLRPWLDGYERFDPAYEYLFNSYYNGVGAQFPRPQRGLLSRPPVETVLRYRRHVDEAMADLLQARGDEPVIRERAELGLHHEQQHQELFFTDLKYSFFCNPLLPVYRPSTADEGDARPAPLRWHEFDGGLVSIGARGDGFCFDNETPCHRVFLEPFALANRLVTNGEFLAFIEDGGYRRPELWLADGWDELAGSGQQAPLYWFERDGRWYEYTLNGPVALDPDRPLCHVSAYEADAFARWSGARLPTEFEWEAEAAEFPVSGQFVDSGQVHPLKAAGEPGLQQLYGSLWQWTASAYSPYPGYQPAAGALGEYNGKFMCNQLVLRGGSCASSRDHLRASYRNFFYPPDRWQFSGIRLACSL